MGKIITFYSYKGGTGRSMALANVAYLLAQWGYRVLVVDWDLEAPGLEHFYKELLDVTQVSLKPGVIDILRQLQQAGGRSPADALCWREYITKVPLSESGPALDFLTAGKRDPEYARKVRDLDVSALYAQYGGGAAIEALRNEWKEAYDLVLVDSRTGVTDIGGICTIQLPDMLVLLATATEQALNGAVEIAQRADAAQKELLADRLRLVALPVPSRFDSDREFKLSNQWMERFAERLAPVYRNWLPTSVKPLEMLQATRLPYVSYFGFGEKLPVIEQSRRDFGGLTFAYENLAALIARDLESADQLIEDRDRFVRTAASLPERRRKTQPQLFISYSQKDQDDRDQLLTHLAALESKAVLAVWNDVRIGPGQDWEAQVRDAISESSVAVLLVSADYLASDFVSEVEIPQILRREQEGDFRVLPVLLRPCAWQYIDWLRDRSVLPEDGKPLSARSEAEREEALVEIVDEIVEAIDRD